MKKTDIQIAKSFLGKDGIVFVIVKNGELLFSSSKKGIQPFFDALKQYDRKEFLNCSIVDKVIGKAALLIAIYLGAKSVYTPLASRHALDAAKQFDIEFTADKIVPYIINWTNDGMCPMEKTVLDIDDPKEAFEKLRIMLDKINNN
jgi:hypothetical protein